MFNIDLDLNNFNHKMIIFIILSTFFTILYYTYDIKYKKNNSIIDYYIISLKIQTLQSNINFDDIYLKLLYIFHTLLSMSLYIYFLTK